MALEARLVQKLNQSLLMTPQLQQAIKLLQLGRIEYLEAIEKELLENPILEEVKEDDSLSTNKAETEIIQFDGSAGDSSDSGDDYRNDSDLGTQSETSDLQSTNQNEPSVDWEGFVESFTDYQGAATPKGLIDHDDKPTHEASTANSETLAEHLLAQIRFADVEDQVKHNAALIVGNLDSNGFLATDLQELAAESNCKTEELVTALEFVRSLDPAGVGAKDLQECLLLQLGFLGLVDSLAYKIISKHLDKLEKKKYELIAKTEKVAIEQVKVALEIIRKLEPYPGRNFSDDATRYVTPDLYVQKVSGEYVISLNEEGMPKLRVNPYYLGLLKKDSNESNENNSQNKEYLQDRMKAAAWLIRSDLQRRQTILKVAQSIVKFQRPFLDHGISRLKPLVLKDVADDIGMHESTVSRVTSNKYIHTSQGVFELKFFFTTGIKSSSGDVSASSIRDRIKSIISAENPVKPVSDQEIVEILSGEKIQIARRTVAKYRETLGIDPSSQRKKVF